MGPERFCIEFSFSGSEGTDSSLSCRESLKAGESRARQLPNAPKHLLGPALDFLSFLQDIKGEIDALNYPFFF